jgi:tripartite ATP-independent transporter DctM subunit
MTGIEVGLLSVTLILVFVLIGMPVPLAFLAVSFIAVWLIRGDFQLAISTMAVSTIDAIADYLFAVIPLFVLMGILVMVADMGRDSYAAANQVFRRVPGGLGLSTVGGNTIFAAITGVSVASAVIFTKIAVPEMLRFGYSPRFAVGVVAGSSVLGMLIPPSLLFILFGILTETSIGKLFLGGVIPGLILALAFGVMIVGWAMWQPQAFGREPAEQKANPLLGSVSLVKMILPIAVLVLIVLGGLYGGFITATEGGAVGASGALVIALLKRKLNWSKFWHVLVEAGAITTALLLLIIGANLYSRVLAMTGLPMQFGTWFDALDIGYYGSIAIFVGILLVLGSLMDAASVLFITIPLVLPVFKAMNVDMVWLGVITVLVIEIGLLTPPFGISVFTVKSALGDDSSITLGDIFAGAMPFAAVMLLVTVLVVCFPWLATALI